MTVPASPEPCYERAGSLCRWVYQRSDQNESLAKLADWFVDRPFRVVVILVVAWLVAWIARRAVRRVVARVVNPERSAGERLGRLGVELPGVMVRGVRDPRREARARSITAVLTSTVTVAIWTLAVLTALGTIGIELGPLIAGAGIAGVALGFGAQSLVRDCIAGLFMLLEDQYGIGDIVDLGEASGVVEEISLRTTVLRSLDGTVWHVPNGVVQRVGNRSQLWSVAVVDVDVAYETDLARARELVMRAAAEVCERAEHRDRILEPATMLGVESLGADGITLRMTVKVSPGAQWDLQRALREHIKHVFDAAAIEIPFPQRTIWMRVDTRPERADADGGGDPDDGDRDDDRDEGTAARDDRPA